jgi:GT2 family glycosyltransferase
MDDPERAKSVIWRVFGLFRRYASQHAHLRKPGFPLLDGSGACIGRVESIAVREGRLCVEGQAHSARVGLASRHQSVSRALTSGAAAQGVAGRTGAWGGGEGTFQLDLALQADRAVLWCEEAGVCYYWPLPPVTPHDLRAMRRAQILPFLRDVLRALPAGLRWLLLRDPLALPRVKTTLGLNTIPRVRQLDAELFQPVAADSAPLPADLSATPVTIVIPVYNAFALLPETLRRVEAHTDVDWQLILVEDGSSDLRVKPWLKAWLANLPSATADRITLIVNPGNLGFIQSVNRALALAIPRGHHVILLNADAFVPQGWASRLLRPLLDGDGVASVTPLSNDAEIFDVPVICKRGSLRPGEGDALDRVAATFHPSAVQAEAPTGVGFCMALHIDYLRMVPTFDTQFGAGYGEEVDWCQKVRQRGGRHLGLGSLFVEHRGGTSFGSEAKLRLVEENGQVISRRYPDFDADVQAFIRDDPLATPRLALGLVLAGLRQAGRMPVYLAHDMGGGAEHYLQDRLKADLSDDAAAVVLRVGGLCRWQVELHSAQGVTAGATDSLALLRRLLALLPARQIIYSCAVGDRDPVSLPEVLISLAQGPADGITVLVHDYLSLSPSYTLLGSDGAFHGLPMPGIDSDPAHVALRPDGSKVSLAQWRVAWGGLMDAAEQITVFSAHSRTLVEQAYPGVAGKIAVQPHRLLTDVPRLAAARAPDGVPVIGVLGNIGHQKGIGVLRDLSRLLARTGRARLVVLGVTDPAYPLAAPARVHGPYAIGDIPALVARYGISRWLIPSIWPETFSYTTHEALATGLPVYSFDLGAQGDAVRAAAAAGGGGGVVPLAGLTPEILLETLLQDKRTDKGTDRPRPIKELPIPTHYESRSSV